jgi:ABC-2 type transport system permease protein
MAEVAGNYIGIICIGAAYISMGVFISSLTENQVVAAVGSLGLFVALFILEQVALLFYTSGVLPVFVMRSLLFISIYGRYNDITRGILALDHIVYFISVCAIFLFLTVRGLERRRWG